MTDIYFKIIPVRDHFELYINGKFYCSADSWGEAVSEAEKYQAALLD